MHRLIAVPLFVIALIFAGLTEMIFETLESEWHHAIMPFGFSLAGVGLVIVAASISIVAVLCGIGCLLNLSADKN
jgi:hypothetical protein